MCTYVEIWVFKLKYFPHFKYDNICCLFSPEIFIERTDNEAEAPIIWPPDAKNWLTGKDSHAGKDWRQEEKGMTEDKMVGWHHQFNGHEFEYAPGLGDG